MKKRISLLLLLSLASLLLLSGCVNLIQEVTVREDGSGSMRVALGIEESTYDYAQELIPEGYELTNILSSSPWMITPPVQAQSNTQKAGKSGIPWLWSSRT